MANPHDSTRRKHYDAGTEHALARQDEAVGETVALVHAKDQQASKLDVQLLQSELDKRSSTSELARVQSELEKKVSYAELGLAIDNSVSKIELAEAINSIMALLNSEFVSKIDFITFSASADLIRNMNESIAVMSNRIDSLKAGLLVVADQLDDEDVTNLDQDYGSNVRAAII